MGIKRTDLIRILRNLMRTLEGWTDRDAEKRRELTGTSFQYQRVGHCQSKGESNRKKKKKEENREQEHRDRY